LDYGRTQKVEDATFETKGISIPWEFFLAVDALEFSGLLSLAVIYHMAGFVDF